MSPRSTVAYTFAHGFYQMVKELFADDPDVWVADGHPGAHVDSPDLIAFLDVTAKQSEATMSTNRSREEDLTQHILISSTRGGEEDDSARKARVYQILGLIEDEVRSGDTTLGSAVRQCFLTEHASKGATEPSVLANGREVNCMAIFTAQARISSN